jgi:DNA (cytosine-5)-methyltransferase 3A
MNVVSLFNGINTGRQALENVGIKVNKYYSSELKSSAIELTQHHFPDTIQVGDVIKWKEWAIDWKSIDLILSGSPCQDLSNEGKRAGINGNKSSLFFVFVEILNHIKKLNLKVLFLQENVGSANKLDVGIISRALGVYPVRINSKLVTAQLRDRYYWSNIKTKQTMFDIVTDIPQPKDLGIMFKDVIENKDVKKLEHKNLKKINLKNHSLLYKYGDELRCKANTIKGYEVVSENDCIDLSFPTSKTRRARVTKGKSPCIPATCINLYSYKNGDVKILSKTELCRLQGFPDNYCDIISKNQTGNLLGDSWTLPIIEHIFSFIKR